MAAGDNPPVAPQFAGIDPIPGTSSITPPPDGAGSNWTAPPTLRPASKDEWATEIDKSKQAVRDAEDAYAKYRLSHPDSYESGDRVLVAGKSDSKPMPTTGEWTQELWDAFQGSSSSQPVLDPEGQSLRNQIDFAKMAYDRDVSDSKEFKSSGPAVQSYADTEEPKTKEIARQLADFNTRADEYQQLLGNEQDYVSGVTANNKDQLGLQQKYGIPPSIDTPYGFGQSLSAILRPSLPDYVRPDYRLNQAVGLPGAEGFDNPNYTSSGFPKYGSGTEIGHVPWSLMPKPDWVWKPRGVVVQ